MTKMDMIWVAVANMLYPNTDPKKCVSLSDIVTLVDRIFKTRITAVMVDRHLVSAIDRQADIDNPRRGGSRNRYLFKTNDGLSPSTNGGFRLYKIRDVQYDAWEKTGPTHPSKEKVGSEYHWLLDWYLIEYSVK